MNVMKYLLLIWRLYIILSAGILSSVLVVSAETFNSGQNLSVLTHQPGNAIPATVITPGQ